MNIDKLADTSSVLMRSLLLSCVTLLLVLTSSGCGSAQKSENAEATPAWILASNKLAAQYSHASAAIFPESGSGLGYREYDSLAIRIDDELESRIEALLLDWTAKLNNLLAMDAAAFDKNFAPLKLSEKDREEVKVDIRVLLEDVEQSLKRRELEKKYGEIQAGEVSVGVFYSLRDLINEQSPTERKKAGVDRFRKYVRGFEEGGKKVRPQSEATKILTEKKIKLFSKKSGPSKGKMYWPLREEVEEYLKKSPKVVEGIGNILEQSGRTDWKEDYEIFKVQVKTYDSWLRTAILPVARRDHKLPKELYSLALHRIGHRSPPEEIRSVARAEFKKSLIEYRAVAAEIAKRDGLSDSSPKAVLRHLKKYVETDPVKVRAIYQKADAELSADIVKRDLVTLPKVPLRIRVASEAESRIQPVPHLTTPPFIGNTGERPEFVVPVGSSDKLAFDDFAFVAAAKGLTAHEGRPGHDLQFSSALDRGVSTIRANYAFNSVNVEGWALYAEWLMEPSMSLDEKMGLLMSRMMRNARMFLDPEIQMGLISPKDAKRVITEEVAMSPEWADLELQRYMYKSPGQAPSYYYGYLKLRAIRDETMKRLGSGFRERCFHDAILSEGLLPLEILAEKIRGLSCS